MASSGASVWAHAPDMKIIFWAQSADETCMRQTFRLIPPDTVYGYLLKSASAEQFCAHGAGRPPRRAVYHRPRLASRLRPRSRSPDGLTDVDTKPWSDIALGLTDQAIAHRRFLSRRGVTSRLHALYNKLGVEQYQRETDAWGQTFSCVCSRSAWPCSAVS